MKSANRRHLKLLLVAALLVPSAPALGAEAAPEYQRAYLLADNGDYLWWNTEPDSPSADLRSLTVGCGTGHPPMWCTEGFTEGRIDYNIWFPPRSKMLEEVAWNADRPLRFRFALDVETTAPSYTVHLVTYPTTVSPGLQVSPPAIETSPGVWEGALTAPGELLPNHIVEMGIRISIPAADPHIRFPTTMRMLTDGSSYVEFPEAASGLSIDDMYERDPAPSAPGSFSTPLHEFRFNDDRWRAYSFEGDLSEPRSFDVPLGTPAAGVVGWAESFSTPVVYHAAREGSVDPQRVTAELRVRVLLDNEEIAGSSQGLTGAQTTAAVDVAAGELTLQVSSQVNGRSGPYKAYILVIEGDRTLRSMRTRFSPDGTDGALPYIWACGSLAIGVPVSNEVNALTLDLDFDAVGPTHRWVPAFSSTLGYGYGHTCHPGSGDRLAAINLKEAATWWVGATPGRRGAFMSFRDVVLDLFVRFLYEPPDA